MVGQENGKYTERLKFRECLKEFSYKHTVDDYMLRERRLNIEEMNYLMSRALADFITKECDIEEHPNPSRDATDYSIRLFIVNMKDLRL